MKMELPSPVLHSLFTLNKAGYEAFVVGGCVRDALMGTEPYDWDITTSARPEETLAVFCDHRRIETGIQHGTVTVIIEDMPLEITTYRVDGNYTDGRHPDSVHFTRCLKEDLRRRDFTVNAIAYHPSIGLIDPFGGQNDLQAAIIRCVGDPKTRFTEDALRILRGLRFSSSLGFAIDPATAAAIHQLTPTLSRVSAERISAEFTKLLCGNNAAHMLTHFSDVFDVILPYSLDFSLLANVVTPVEPKPLPRYGALLFSESIDTITSIANRLKFSRRFAEDLLTLCKNKSLPVTENKQDILHLLQHLGPELIRDFLSIRSAYDARDYADILAKAEQLTASGACYRICDLSINGTDLIACGVTPGPHIGDILNTLLEAVIQDACPNTKEALLHYTKEKSLC